MSENVSAMKKEEEKEKFEFILIRLSHHSYSISSACMTPIHSPHRDVLVLCKRDKISLEKEREEREREVNIMTFIMLFRMFTKP
jgi:hypothetical protein